MNLQEARRKIDTVQKKLEEMKAVTSFVEINAHEIDEYGIPRIEGGINMVEIFPDANQKLHSAWEEIKENAPPGFSFDSNLLRHLTFNHAADWLDITKRDIPRELKRVEEYRRRIELINYMDTLHPEVSRVTEIVLSGDVDAALRTVYSTLDSKIRVVIDAVGTEMTVPAIGRAFKEGKLRAPHDENNDGARNFLQGTLGYYRNWILHNVLPLERNQIEGAMSLFALAHEAFKLLDACSKPHDPFI